MKEMWRVLPLFSSLSFAIINYTMTTSFPIVRESCSMAGEEYSHKTISSNKTALT
uniref:Uncharacterized protein n=1 Tax=Octopus bimaculoides TaxID=37653 RepID=A0A0L8GXC3_OCTBM